MISGALQKTDQINRNEKLCDGGAAIVFKFTDLSRQKSYFNDL